MDPDASATKLKDFEVIGQGRHLRLVSDGGLEYVERTGARGAVAIHLIGRLFNLFDEVGVAFRGTSGRLARSGRAGADLDDVMDIRLLFHCRSLFDWLVGKMQRDWRDGANYFFTFRRLSRH